MKYKIGDIVQYNGEKHCTGIVIGYHKSYINEKDKIEVIFFHDPYETYYYYLKPSIMKKCWKKMK